MILQKSEIQRQISRCLYEYHAGLPIREIVFHLDTEGCVTSMTWNDSSNVPGNHDYLSVFVISEKGWCHATLASASRFFASLKEKQQQQHNNIFM
jgi:hypothetical protein